MIKIKSKKNTNNSELKASGTSKLRIRKNPTDKEFLKQVKIEKSKYRVKPKYGRETPLILHYVILLNNIEIGYADIIEDFNVINSIDIEYKYQRKGLATYIYKHIEDDLDIKLKPSKNQTNDGKDFWKNRLKKQNPTDKLFLSQIKIQKEKIKYYIRYKAYLDNNVVATADFFPKDNSVSSVYVNSLYRRKGLASFMYDTIEKDQKVSLIPSQDLLPDGRRFWENRIKDKPEKLGLLYR